MVKTWTQTVVCLFPGTNNGMVNIARKIFSRQGKLLKICKLEEPKKSDFANIGIAPAHDKLGK
jgi:hypothetical protein